MTCRIAVPAIALVMSVAALGAVSPEQSPPVNRMAEARAVAYLSIEVPRWHREHSYTARRVNASLRIAKVERGA